MILVEAVNNSSNEDASSESDKEPSCDEEDESRRYLRTQYVHPKGKDKGGRYLYVACTLHQLWVWCEAVSVPKSWFNFDFTLSTPLIYNSTPINTSF